MSTLPVYGPTDTQNVHDDQPAPHLVVHVAYQLSREELLAVFIHGYATTNLGTEPHGMTVEQIRYDVEAYLADTSLLYLSDRVEELRAQQAAGKDAARLHVLAKAMDRAYPAKPGKAAPAAIHPEILDWHRGAVEGDPAVCGMPQPGQPAFPCLWNRSAHSDHRDLLGRTWRGGERP
ncbi:hypothetical protein OID55_10905 [Streptomyces sp. NBC_00715]|uniref:hypothetical protein n=1 Tax=Streptomyces sp. NBC_00715 TaxID=2975811 RepID=UPI00386A8CA5